MVGHLQDSPDDSFAHVHQSHAQLSVEARNCAESPWMDSPLAQWYKRHQTLLAQRSGQPCRLGRLRLSASWKALKNSQGVSGTPDASMGEDACQSSQQREDANLSADSAELRVPDRNIRLSCTGVGESRLQFPDVLRPDASGSQLRLAEQDLDDDGSNSEAALQNSPSASGCEAPAAPPASVGKASSRSLCANSASTATMRGAAGSPSNAASGNSGEQSIPKQHLPAAGSLSAHSYEAFHSCG
jgi:hypothetical protein